jgi:hypothetical protein
MPTYNGVGSGTGLMNGYLQAEKFQQSQPGMVYNPNQYLDPNQLLAMSQMQQQAYMGQMFNQQNPRMALPQNVGAAVGGALSRALTPSQAGNPQQGTQQDPTNQIQQEYYKRTAQQYQALMAQAGGKPVNPLQAQYAAASSFIGDPTYGQSSIAQNFAAQRIDEISKQWSPEKQSTIDANIAAKNASTAEAQDKQLDIVSQIKKRQQDDQMVPVKWTKGPDGKTMVAQQAGGFIPAYLDDNLTPDPDLPAKLNAAKAATGADQMMPFSTFNALKGNQQAAAQTTIIMRADEAEKTRQDAINDVNQNLAREWGHKLYTGDAVKADIVSGNNPSQNALFNSATEFANQEAAANGDVYSPTDAANRKKAESSWMSGQLGQQYLKAATAPRHLADLEQIASGLDSGTFKPGNDLYQRWSRNMGYSPGTQVPAFELARSVFVQELGGALNARGGSDREKEVMEGTINNADAPQTLKTTLATEEKLWADKMDDMAVNYEQNVKGKKFFGDVVNPGRQTDAMNIYSKYYPIQIGTGDTAERMFNTLPPDTLIQTPGKRVMKVSDAKALIQANK